MPLCVYDDLTNHVMTFWSIRQQLDLHLTMMTV
jgi:hypothetical protein